MASTKDTTERTRARTAYLAAAGRLADALLAYQASGVVLVPVDRLMPWTDAEIRAVVAVCRGWNELVKTRKDLEMLLREQPRLIP